MVVDSHHQQLPRQASSGGLHACNDLSNNNGGTMLEAAIQHSLTTLNFKNAIFLAQRLLSFTQSHPTSNQYVKALYLLSLSHIHNQQPLYALNILEGEYELSPSLMYLYGQACLSLKRYVDGERVLRKLIQDFDPTLKVKKSSEEKNFEPKNRLSLSGMGMTSGLDWSAVYTLQGTFSRKLNRIDEAITAFKRSLELNPLNWASYEAICQLGNQTEPKLIFSETNIERSWSSVRTMSEFNDSENVSHTHERLKEEQASKKQNRGVSNPPSKKSVKTKKPTTAPTSSIQNTRLRTASSNNTLRPTTAATLGRKRTHEGIPVANETVTNRETHENAFTLSTINITTKEISKMLITIGSGYAALGSYKCKNAIEHLTSLPISQRKSADIQGAIAKAHFESSSFQKAYEIFSEIRKSYSYRVEQMDLYGTCLWHLRNKAELSFLGKEMKEMNRLSPQTWCVIGNFFSLNQEHDQAICAFQRAIQLDEEFEYAYTLLGHEYLSNEDLDHALTAFRKAVQINPRHYNALYGLGLIYSKQEKYGAAEFHFRRALELHSEHPVLLSLTGTVVQKDPQRLEEALEYFEKAERVAPKHPPFKFHKAQVLASMGKYKDALAQLEDLTRISQPEANVYFLMGTLYKQTGNIRKALESFTCAMDYHQMSHFHGYRNDGFASGMDGIFLTAGSAAHPNDAAGGGLFSLEGGITTSSGSAPFGTMISHSKMSHLMKEAIESLFRPVPSEEEADTTEMNEIQEGNADEHEIISPRRRLFRGDDAAPESSARRSARFSSSSNSHSVM